ncbi:hypothetical protein ACFL2V_04825 [Pseudomonadota bacterium]
MNDNAIGKAHWSFWVIGIVLLIWNVMGCINFFVQMDPEILASYGASARAIVEDRPLWATAGFAVAVFGGALGCLILLLRKRVAYYLFVASLLGVIVTMIHALGLGIEFGSGELIGMVLMPLVVAAFLIWYSKSAESKGWLK